MMATNNGIINSGRRATSIVEENFWQEKRFDRKDALSAWTLVLAMLAVSLAFTGVSAPIP